MPVLEAIEGVPESALAGEVAARVPAASAEAPWDVRLEAVVWWHRAALGAERYLPAALRGRRTVPLTVGAFVRYLDTPVGPYHEVLGAPVLLAEAPLPAVVVPFIAVDSLASVHGGRANWALPKVLARFEWPAGTARGFEVDAEGDGWSVLASVRPRPRRFPVAAPVRNRQVTASGAEIAFDTRARGRATGGDRRARDPRADIAALAALRPPRRARDRRGARGGRRRALSAAGPRRDKSTPAGWGGEGAARSSAAWRYGHARCEFLSLSGTNSHLAKAVTARCDFVPLSRTNSHLAKRRLRHAPSHPTQPS